MGANSKIEWTASIRKDGSLAPGYTGNLWWGCTAVHAGCDHCYAETFAKSKGKKVWGNDAPRVATKAVWGNFLKWQAEAHAAGEICRVFVGSMMDIFEKPMPLVSWQGDIMPKRASDDAPALFVPGAQADMRMDTGDLRNRFFREIVPACPNLDFLLLTKRPSNINKYIPEEWKTLPPPNVMFGTSPVDEKTWDTLVPQLLKVNGRRFLSVEPQLGPLRVLPIVDHKIDWVIQGGESGAKRRPFDLEWARWLRDWCADQNLPYFFKQIDKILPIPEDLMIRQFPPQTWLDHK